MNRVTVYLEPELHRALKLRAAESGRNVSALINEMVRQGLATDLEDLDTFEERAAEPAFSFELVLRNLRRRGEI
ncbi:MAG: ribbon-helix-helix domain-containing protein [Acidobacteriota bacterium]|nr:ribbon-helix-helix domain-containing protein [Acidobacteriota bacterium]MDH3522057.1 ribbon-helix-helix domain-containing protein [Acidobacteriota bacterium]